MAIGKRAGDIARYGSIFFVLTLLALVFPIPAMDISGDAGNTRGHPGRDFGDPGNDTALEAVNTHSEGMTYGLRAQEINITLANYNSSFAIAVSVNFTVKCTDTGLFEDPANTSGNVSSFLLPINGTRDHSLSWIPSAEGNFLINITTTNEVGWPNDPDAGNNNFTLNVVIQNMTDVGADISNPSAGQEIELGSIFVSAWVNNSGSVNISNDFDIELKITNKTTNATDFTDTDTIPASITPLNYDGAGYPVTFNAWTPSSPGLYDIRVTTLLPGDTNPSNDVHLVTVNITPVYFNDFEVSVTPLEQYAEPGGSPVQITFTIHNIGTLQDSYDYRIESGKGWLVGDNPATGTTNQVAPGGLTSVPVFVLVPPGTGFEVIDGVNITAISNNNISLYRGNVSYIYTYEEHDVQVELRNSPAFGDPGDSIDYTFTITNLGNMGMNFSLILTTSPSKWTTEIKSKEKPYTTDFIRPDESEDVIVTVNIPELVYETRVADHTYAGAIAYFTLKAESRHASDSDNVITTINSISRADIWANRTWVVRDPIGDAQRVDLNLSVRNINNAKVGGLTSLETIDITVQTVMFLANWSGADYDSERWTAETSKSNVSVGGGEIDSSVRLSIHIPPNPYNGSGYISVSAVPRNDLTAQPDYTTVYVYITQKAGVRVTASEPKLKEGAPTDVVNFNFNVENTGNGQDIILLNTESKSGWENSVVGGYDNLTLNPENNLQVVTVSITVPPYDAATGTPNIGYEDISTLNARSGFDRAINDNDTVTVRVKQGYGVKLDPDYNSSKVDPGDSMVYTINVTNQGNGKDTIDLIDIYTPLDGWSMSLSANQVEDLPKGEIETVTVTVTAGEDASAIDSFLVTIRGTSRGNTSKQDTANVTTTVEQVPGIEISLLSPESQSGMPGDNIYFELEIKNTGNGRDNFSFEIPSKTYNWTSLLSETETEVDPFQNTIVLLTVQIPEIDEGDMEEELIEKGIVAGTMNEIKFNATSGVDRSYVAIEKVSVSVNALYDPYLTTGITEDEVLPGDTASYIIKVLNKGNGFDNISLTNQRSHTNKGHLSIDVVQLEPGTAQYVTLEVDPGQNGSYVDEIYQNKITPRSGIGGNSGNSLTFKTTIVFMDLVNLPVPEANVNISTTGKVQTTEYEFKVMNVPESPGDLTGQDTFTLTATTHQGNLRDLGWSYGLSNGSIENDTLTVTIGSSYGSSTFKLRIRAPDDENQIDTTAMIDVKAKSHSRPAMEHLISTETTIVYVDFAFKGALDFNHNEFDEGGLLEITATIQASGTVPVSGLVVSLYVNGELVATNNTVERFALSRNDTSISKKIKFSWDIPSLAWDEKAREYDVELRLDEKNAIYETSKSVNAEENNEIKGHIMVKDHAIPPALSGIILLVCIVLGFVVYKRINEERALFFIFGILSGIIAGCLFAMPWELISAGAATWIGRGIIWTFLIGIFTFVSLVLCLNSRSYIEYLINEKARADKLKYEFFKKDEEEGLKKKFSFIPDNVIWKPYLIAGAGAFVQVPLFFLFISIHGGTSIVLVGLVVGLIYLAIACLAVWQFIRYNLEIYKHITSAERLIDEIREETLDQMRLEVKPMSGDSRGGPRRRSPPGDRRRGRRPSRGSPGKRRRPPGGGKRQGRKGGRKGRKKRTPGGVSRA